MQLFTLLVSLVTAHKGVAWVNPTRPQRSLRIQSLKASLDPLEANWALDGVDDIPKQLRKKKLKPFARYLEVECWKQAELRELQPVLQAVADACKQINRIVRRAQTDDVYGAAVDMQGQTLEENIQGEVQQKLDVLCNTKFLRAFCGSSRHIHSVASEEEDEPRCCSDVMVGVFHSSNEHCTEEDLSSFNLVLRAASVE